MNRKVTAAAAIGIPALIVGGLAVARARQRGNAAVPEPAKPVELQRYLGRWYEQFRYEAPFEKGMEAVTADYFRNSDGSIRVVNRGRKGGLDGQEKSSTGKAKVVDQATNAKLKVTFFGSISGDYWVLDHADDYAWSIVGEPSGRYLWALTRDKKPGEATVDMLRERARTLGYDGSKIRRTQQP